MNKAGEKTTQQRQGFGSCPCAGTCCVYTCVYSTCTCMQADGFCPDSNNALQEDQSVCLQLAPTDGLMQPWPQNPLAGSGCHSPAHCLPLPSPAPLPSSPQPAPKPLQPKLGNHGWRKSSADKPVLDQGSTQQGPSSLPAHHRDALCQLEAAITSASSPP